MTVRWGVIGAGGIADRRTIPEGIIPAAGAELVAVQDVDEARAKGVGEKYGLDKVFTSEIDLLELDDIDAVYIATPTNVHAAQVKAAATRGKHVLCEKPLGMTIQEVEEEIQVCKDAGVKLGTNFMMRFHSCHTRLRDMIQAGELGRLVFGRAELTCWYPPIPGAFRQDPALGGGGSLIDMGNHCIDLLEFFFGKVAEVSCFTGNLVQDYKSEDTGVAMLRFESGAVGFVDNLFNVPDAAARNALEVYGSKGSVAAFGTIGQDSSGSLIAVLEKGDKGYDAGQVRDVATPQETITPDVVNMYQAHIEAFCQAIANDTEPPITGEDGLWSHRVIDACYESARTGKTVKP
ncbi:MAG: Gfo/Idh/MocA family oxidoreductase [Acidobacteriota bacterium]|jgi:predicted dehydrogenase|nr:Gfo/Idh/MocA family oxidoreductase [Acidobacteriota bacterium]